MPKNSRPPISVFLQLIIGFVIPTLVLMNLSDESKLGPLAAMGLALLPPILLEIYSFFTGRKASILSVFAIVGVLLIGVISLFGLSEEWLGVRRSGIYIIGALFIAGVLLFKRNWIDKGLAKLIDIESVNKASKEKNTEAQISKHITKVAYLFVGLLVVIAIWSYVLTTIVITSPTGSSEFNAEYAQLRLLGIPFVTVPLVIGATILLMYLATGFEKITGIGL